MSDGTESSKKSRASKGRSDAPEGLAILEMFEADQFEIIGGRKPDYSAAVKDFVAEKLKEDDNDLKVKDIHAVTFAFALQAAQRGWKGSEWGSLQCKYGGKTYTAGEFFGSHVSQKPMDSESLSIKRLIVHFCEPIRAFISKNLSSSKAVNISYTKYTGGAVFPPEIMFVGAEHTCKSEAEAATFVELAEALDEHSPLVFKVIDRTTAILSAKGFLRGMGRD